MDVLTQVPAIEIEVKQPEESNKKVNRENLRYGNKKVMKNF